MAREKLSGIYIPVVTPFHRDESINFSAIKEITRFLADNGVTGIIPSGSTGEMIALTKEEQIAVNKAYIEAGHDNGIKVVASTGAYRTCDVVELSKAAESDGADGIMAVTPWYMGPNEKELLVHYKTIHDAISIPVMLYHNPYYSTVLMSDKFMAKLYLEGCIDAVKERQADVFRQQNLRRLKTAVPDITSRRNSDFRLEQPGQSARVDVQRVADHVQIQIAVRNTALDQLHALLDQQAGMPWNAPARTKF